MGCRSARLGRQIIPASFAKRVMDKVQENDIILLHDASESSVNAALLIIDELQGEGYSFVTVEELILE